VKSVRTIVVQATAKNAVCKHIGILAQTNHTTLYYKMADKVNLPKVVYAKLGSSRPKLQKNGKSKTPFGIWSDGIIKVDPRQEPSEMLDTLVHEILHEAQPEITEEGIERISEMISAVLWREGYRKVEI
jgi:hypothetical protein